MIEESPNRKKLKFGNWMSHHSRFLPARLPPVKQ